jgi:hypothetical protein
MHFRHSMLMSALLLWLTTSANSQAIVAPAATSSHDFGSVKAGTVVTHMFTVTRPGPGASVQRVELSAPGMKARVTAAAEHGEHDDELGLIVTWNTTVLDGPVESQALVHWNDQSYAPVRLTLRGMVTPVISLEPFPAVFFSVYQDKGGEGMVKIVNRDDRPLEITQLEPLGSHFTAQVRTLIPGQEYALVVRVPAGTEFGRFQESIVVHTNQPARPEVPVAVNVLVKPDLYASPEVVDFGEVNREQLLRVPALRDGFTQVVGIMRRQGAFAITSVGSDIPGLDIKVAPSGPAETFRMDINLIPDQLKQGVVSGMIRLGTSDPMFPEIAVPVRGEIR